MDLSIVFLSVVILVVLGFIANYYSTILPSDGYNDKGNGKKKDVPLYIYESVGRSARKWSSFRDRMHKEPRSAYLELCDNTHAKNHTIGKIIPVTDADLMKLIPTADTNIDLQYNRMLRDSLLLTMVCQNGGIVIPRNTILLNSTELLYNQAVSANTILYAGSGNSDYGCPIIVSNGGCGEYADIILKEASVSWFKDGIMFNGGLPLILERSRAYKINTDQLSGVREMDVNELVREGEYNGGDILVRIPFPQASGTSTIARRDEWLFSVSFEELMGSPIVLKDMVMKSCNGNIMRLVVE